MSKRNNLMLFLDRYFFLFLILNITIYLFINKFHDLVIFNDFNYQNSAFHYIQDSRLENNNFNLIDALSQYDSQWYLYISKEGYSKNPKFDLAKDTYKIFTTLHPYAFYPLYPIVLKISDYLINNIQLTAFVTSNIILTANFLSLYFILTKLFNINLARKTLFLFFFFPFSIFFRSYYAEGLQLFLLIWFAYCLVKNKLLAAAIFLSLLNITKGNLVLLNFFLIYKIYFKYKTKVMLKTLSILIILCLPLSLWLLFMYFQTGDPFIFLKAQHLWYPSNLPPIIYNLFLLSMVPIMQFHTFHYSQLEIFIIFIIGILLFKSYKKIPFELWAISLILFLTPLFVKDIQSFTRLQIISFPIFIYIAKYLQQKPYFLCFILFYSLLLITSVYFVNWYWVG